MYMAAFRIHFYTFEGCSKMTFILSSTVVFEQAREEEHLGFSMNLCKLRLI